MIMKPTKSVAMKTAPANLYHLSMVNAIYKPCGRTHEYNGNFILQSQVVWFHQQQKA